MSTTVTGFHAKIDTTILGEYLSAVNALVDECVLHFTDDGLRTRAVDPANVAMLDINLGYDIFLEAEGDEHEFAVNTYRLLDLLDSVDESTVTLDYQPDRNKLGLQIGPYSYAHSCTDPDLIRDRPDVPDLDLGFEGRMKIDQLREAIEWFDTFTTHIRMGYEPVDDRFWIEAMERNRSGDVKTDDGGFELSREELEYVRQGGEADSHFSLDYFKDIIEPIPEGRTVTLRVGEEFPMNLSYKFGWEGTGPNEGTAHGEVTFMQAPRIQSD